MSAKSVLHPLELMTVLIIYGIDNKVRVYMPLVYMRGYKSINNIISNSNYLIPPELLNRTYENLSQFSNVDYSTKIQHIYNIK